MLGFVSRRLSVKLSLFLACIVIPALAASALMVTQRESAVVEDLVLQKAKAAALAGAAAYGAVLDTGVDSGALTLPEVLEPTYDEISFLDENGQPIKIEDKRYNTKLASYTDTHGVQAIEDRTLAASPDFLYASGMDRRGYVPTPHRKYAEPPTGDFVRDRKVSRARRKYTKPEQIAAAGFEGTDRDTTLVQPYLRDTGESAWDVAAPIYVKGRHFGGFRVGVARDQIAARRHELILGLSLLFGLLTVAIVGSIFWLSWRYIRPLSRLSALVNEMSTDNSPDHVKLSVRIVSRDQSEVGQMARAVDRFRNALRTAMALLDAKA